MIQLFKKYIVRYYIKWVTTSWTYSINIQHIDEDWNRNYAYYEFTYQALKVLRLV